MVEGEAWVIEFLFFDKGSLIVIEIIFCVCEITQIDFYHVTSSTKKSEFHN